MTTKWKSVTEIATIHGTCAIEFGNGLGAGWTDKGANCNVFPANEEENPCGNVIPMGSVAITKGIPFGKSGEEPRRAPCNVQNARVLALILAGVHLLRDSDLAQIRRTLHAIGLLFGGAQRRQKKRDKKGDHGNDDEELHKGKRSLILAHDGPFRIRTYGRGGE